MTEDHDFQGFGEEFSSPPLTPRQRLTRESEEYLSDMERRLDRINRAMLTYGRKPPRALREEGEVLASNIAHFNRRWGLD